jgi:hypothetical protein
MHHLLNLEPDSPVNLFHVEQSVNPSFLQLVGQFPALNQAKSNTRAWRVQLVIAFIALTWLDMKNDYPFKAKRSMA